LVDGDDAVSSAGIWIGDFVLDMYNYHKPNAIQSICKSFPRWECGGGGGGVQWFVELPVMTISNFWG